MQNLSRSRRPPAVVAGALIAVVLLALPAGVAQAEPAPAKRGDVIKIKQQRAADYAIFTRTLFSGLDVALSGGFQTGDHDLLLSGDFPIFPDVITSGTTSTTNGFIGFAFQIPFHSPVQVATGDIDGDGIPDIIMNTPGPGPLVLGFDLKGYVNGGGTVLGRIPPVAPTTFGYERDLSITLSLGQTFIFPNVNFVTPGSAAVVMPYLGWTHEFGTLTTVTAPAAGTDFFSNDVGRDGLTIGIDGRLYISPPGQTQFFIGAGPYVTFYGSDSVTNRSRFWDLNTRVGSSTDFGVKFQAGVQLDTLSSFFAFSPQFSGGVYVAAGDERPLIRAQRRFQ